MSRLVPTSVRESVVETLTREAADADWDHRLQSDKTRLLRQWVDREDIGGMLRPLLGSDAEVRMWLKDVGMKRRARAALPSAGDVVARTFGELGVTIDEEGIKPAHCYVTLDDRRLFVCWERFGNAKHLLWACVRTIVDDPDIAEACMVIVESMTAPTPRSARVNLEAIAKRCGVTVRWIGT